MPLGNRQRLQRLLSRPDGSRTLWEGVESETNGLSRQDRGAPRDPARVSPCSDKNSNSGCLAVNAVARMDGAVLPWTITLAVNVPVEPPPRRTDTEGVASVARPRQPAGSRGRSSGSSGSSGLPHQGRQGGSPATAIDINFPLPLEPRGDKEE